MDQNPTPAPEAPVAQPTPTFDGAAQSSADSTGVQPTQNAKKGLAIAALICGICGLCLCFVGCLGLILAITGVVLGIMALIKKQNKGMAIAGLVCGGVGLIPGAIFTVLMVMALGIVGVASTIANDYNSYLNDSVEYCNTYPESSYCTIEYDYDYDWDDDNDTCEDDIFGDDCYYGSDEFMEEFCSKYPESDECDDYADKSDNGTTSYDFDNKKYDWIDKELAELAAEEEGEVSEEEIEASKKFIVCMIEEGIDIKSLSDVERFEFFDPDSDENDEVTDAEADIFSACFSSFSEFVTE